MKQHGGSTAWLYAVPAMLLFTLIIAVPTAMTFMFSIMEWRRFQPLSLGTVQHYLRLPQDLTLRRAFNNNFVYIFWTLILEVGTGLTLAGVAIHLRRSTLFRSLVFAPVVLPSIVTGLLWQQAFAFESGLLNRILLFAGAEPLRWLGPPLTVFSISLVSGWIWAGFFMTIFYAGLVRIPESFLESALLDGASPLTIFFRIQVPLIRNLIVLGLLIVTTGGFKGFDLWQVMLRRDPLESGVVLPTYLVRTFFENRNIGYGSAISVLLTAVVIGIMGVVALIRRFYVGEMEEY
ncbi:MAG: sugar ABC transporter permease [Spirochaetaceae bacterium]|nr:MAG: sugar ABC transporter permease [Spirochaetaceae bacterium]